MSGRGYLFFTVMSFKPLKSIHGRRVPSFLPTKKNPAPRGDEEGRIIPAASELLMYSSIATRSGLEMLYRRLRGNVDPGNRSMAQSYGRCGGSERALCLQNTSEISWYSAGIDDRSRLVWFGFLAGYRRRQSRPQTTSKTGRAPVMNLSRSPVNVRIMFG